MKKKGLRWIDDVRRGIDPEDRVHNEAMVEAQPGAYGKRAASWLGTGLPPRATA